MEVLKYSTEVSNIPRTCLEIPRRYEIFHGGAEIFHGRVKYSTKGVKYSAEAWNIPGKCLNIPRRWQIFHGGVKYSRKV